MKSLPLGAVVVSLRDDETPQSAGADSSPYRGAQRVKKASQSLPHLRQIKSNLFCGGAHPRVASLVPLGQFTFCTRRKIQYRTQVCSLSASSGQRASPKGISVGHAQCPARDFVEKPNRFFDRLKRNGQYSSAHSFSFCYLHL